MTTQTTFTCTRCKKEIIVYHLEWDAIICPHYGCNEEISIEYVMEGVAQWSLFDTQRINDVDRREDNKRHGMKQAESNANEQWRQAAINAIDVLAASGKAFTSDTVIAFTEAQGLHTHNLSALGPLFRRASNRAIIGKTGRVVPSTRPSNHRDLTEWVGIADGMEPR